jgi:LacI family transcriptional regulator
MSSIRKIAQIAGVSPTTVFRALHNDPHVLPETRQRVLELVKLYEYKMPSAVQPHQSAIPTLGCIIPSVGNSYCARVLQGVLEVAFAESYHVITLESHFNVLHTCKALQTLVEQRVQGIVILGGHYEPIPRASALELWSSNIVPVVLDATTMDASVDRVHIDEHAMARMAVDYLWDFGHRVIGYLGPLPNGKNAPGRPRAIKHALEARGVSTKYMMNAMPSTVEEIVEVTRTLLCDPHGPTAIITQTDGYGAIVTREAVRLGLRVPEDISLLACLNSWFSSHLLPAITAVEQYPEKVGSQAVELLLRRLREGDGLPHRPEPETIAIAPVLYERESCAPPPAVRHVPTACNV